MTGADPWSLGSQTVDNDYPADWDARRKKAYRRDDYTCQNCGAEGGPHGDVELHAHHIVPKSRGGSHSLNNLTTLCYSCHNAVHDHHIPRQTSRRVSTVNSDDTSETETTPMSVESAHYEYMRGNLDDEELEQKIEARLESEHPNKIPSEPIEIDEYEEDQDDTHNQQTDVSFSDGQKILILVGAYAFVYVFMRGASAIGGAIEVVGMFISAAVLLGAVVIAWG